MNSLDHLRSQFESTIEDFFNQYETEPRLKEAMIYALQSGGKRIRPLMLLSLIESIDESQIHHSLPVAMALEFIHTYSLVHDDLPAMDDDDYRRGRLSVHKKFDEATAILVGDALLTQSFEILSQISELSAETRISLIQMFSQAAGAQGMIQGQYLDLNPNETSQTLSELQRIHALKTGALYESIALVVSDLTKLDDQTTSLLRQLMASFGLAVQIHNDLIDEIGTDTQTGKQGHSDDLNETLTYPKLIGVEATKQALEKTLVHIDNIIKQLKVQSEIKLTHFETFTDVLKGQSK